MALDIVIRDDNMMMFPPEALIPLISVSNDSGSQSYLTKVHLMISSKVLHSVQVRVHTNHI